jgi:hypothetical protein
MNLYAKKPKTNNFHKTRQIFAFNCDRSITKILSIPYQINVHPPETLLQKYLKEERATRSPAKYWTPFQYQSQSGILPPRRTSTNRSQYLI